MLFLKQKLTPWQRLAIALIVLSLAIVAFAPVAQGIQRFNAVIARVLTVQTSAQFQGTTTIDDLTFTGNIANRSLFLRYQDVAAAPSIYAEAEVVTGTTSITTSILGIETPRNALLTFTSDTTRTAGTVTIAGADARGNSTTETLSMAASPDEETLTGAVPWKSITSFTIPAQTSAVTLTVTGGQKFGLPIVPVAASDVYHLTVAATPQAAPTVNTTYGTFDPVSTPAANVDYNVWMKQ